MNRYIIKDKTGTPVSVLVGYEDWLAIEHALRLSGGHLTESDHPLDWYTLTETSKAILHELIAYVGRQQFEELKKAAPDALRIEELKTLFKEIHDINNDPGNFKSISRMQGIIATYGPMLRAVQE